MGCDFVVGFGGVDNGKSVGVGHGSGQGRRGHGSGGGWPRLDFDGDFRHCLVVQIRVIWKLKYYKCVFIKLFV